MSKESASRPRVRSPRALACLLLLAPLCAWPTRAQEGREGARREPAARKVSEYVNQFSSCNAGAHLDNLAVELQSTPPTTRARVIIYGPGGEGDGYAKHGLLATKNYLVSTRGIEESRVETVYGGAYRKKGEVLTELWLVPEGAEPPPLTEYKNDAATFVGKFADAGTWDDTYFGAGDVEGWSHSGEARTVALADMLRSRSGTRAYLVVFNGEESLPGAWRRIAERETNALKRYGVAGERVRVIFGGYREAPTLQLWVLPENAPPPAKDAGRERRPEKAVQLGSYDQFGLKYDDGARAALKQLADVLKSDEALTAAVVVRLEAPREVNPDDPPPPPPDPDEPPDLDFVQVVERWKVELKKEYGIGEQRLLVTVVPPQEDSPQAVETWIVPPGVAPPNPFAAAVEEEAVGEPPRFMF